MNRLQKKCVIASAGFHLSLVLILIFGAAFFSSDSATKDVPIIDFIPLKTIDDARSGGGNPRAQPPPASQPPAPQPPAPQPLTVQAAQPVTPVEPPKDTTPDPENVESKPKPRRKIEVNTNLVRSDPNDKASVEKRARDERRRAAATALSDAANGLKSSLSPSTTIEMRGPGGGGVPYANFLSAVKSIYTDAWLAPVGVTDDSATTTAEITIARDGRVISATITRFSGNSAVDQSVQATLDRVRVAVPLPDDAKEDRRTVTINFNLKAKLIG
jgi:TonB family protein